jgi:hypothetical protein
MKDILFKQHKASDLNPAPSQTDFAVYPELLQQNDELAQTLTKF